MATNIEMLSSLSEISTFEDVYTINGLVVGFAPSHTGKDPFVHLARLDASIESLSPVIEKVFISSGSVIGIDKEHNILLLALTSAPVETKAATKENPVQKRHRRKNNIPAGGPRIPPDLMAPAAVQESHTEENGSVPVAVNPESAESLPS